MMTPGDRSRSRLAFGLMVMIGAAMLHLLWMDTPPSNRELISLVLGALLTKLTDVYSFHFGSSASSQSKDLTIGKQAEATNTMATTAALSKGQGNDTVVLGPGETASTQTVGETAIIQKDDGTQRVDES